MVRVASVVLLAALAILPLPVRGAPETDERAAIEEALDSLRTTADRLAALTELYLRERRIDEARAAVEAVAEIARTERDLAARLAALPPPEPTPGPTPAPGPVEDIAGCVDLGLSWLAAHQDADGVWDCDGFMEYDRETGRPECDGAGNAQYDIGVTGLALLAFLGAGNTPGTGPHAKAVRRALYWLRTAQDPEGCFGPRTSTHFTYCTAIATLALCEAYGLTADARLKEHAQRGVGFLQRCRNPHLAWRYGFRPGDNDTSVSGWMTRALCSAKHAGLEVDELSFHGMQGWLDRVTEPEYGRVGYTARGTGSARPMELMDRFPADLSESLTAVGILCRMLMGEEPEKSEPVRKGLALLAACPPAWREASGSIDMYYWYHGTLATCRAGGGHWGAWSGALKEVLGHQRTGAGPLRGSFDPIGPWGREGGRVYSTALMTLCAEVLLRSGEAAPEGK
jgi:hypothetical protein